MQLQVPRASEAKGWGEQATTSVNFGVPLMGSASWRGRDRVRTPPLVPSVELLMRPRAARGVPENEGGAMRSGAGCQRRHWSLRWSPLLEARFGPSDSPLAETTPRRELFIEAGVKSLEGPPAAQIPDVANRKAGISFGRVRQGPVNPDTLNPDTQHPSKPIFPHCGTNKIMHCSISGINPDTGPKSLQNPPKPGHRPQSCTAAIKKCTGAEKSDFAGKGAVSLVFRVLVNLCPGLGGPDWLATTVCRTAPPGRGRRRHSAA